MIGFITSIFERNTSFVATSFNLGVLVLILTMARAICLEFMFLMRNNTVD